jgi:pyruvate dehydrogenase (quinone)
MGVRVDNPDKVASAWDTVLAADRPALFEAYVDPNVAPMPPHITLEQAKDLTSAVLKRDAQSLGFMKQIAKEVLAGVTRRG